MKKIKLFTFILALMGLTLSNGQCNKEAKETRGATSDLEKVAKHMRETGVRNTFEAITGSGGQGDSRNMDKDSKQKALDVSSANGHELFCVEANEKGNPILVASNRTPIDVGRPIADIKGKPYQDLLEAIKGKNVPEKEVSGNGWRSVVWISSKLLGEKRTDQHHPQKFFCGEFIDKE